MAAASIVDTIRRFAAANNVDPAAVLAVARQEGLSGGIGDNGTSFGPFQLHVGGALPQAIGARGPQYAQQWASSPAGILYAIQRIAQVAGGLKGAPAVRAIVTRFERPANPQREIAGALDVLGLPVPAAGAVTTPAAPAAATAAMRGGFSPLLQQVMSSNNAMLGLPALNLPTLPATAAWPPAAAAPSPVGGGIAELLREGTGGPTNSTGPHLHFAATTPAAMLAALRRAASLGLAARENAYVDPVDPVHAKNSYHYRTFPGVYDGRTLGQATDFSGDPKAVTSLYQWIQSRFGGAP